MRSRGSGQNDPARELGSEFYLNSVVMAKTGITSSVSEQNRTIAAYYEFQSRIYDLTRWGFLFGRRQLVQDLPFSSDQAFTVLEVGCGTGYNLRQIAHQYPQAQLTGMDLSADMLAIARKNVQPYSDRVQLQQQPYGTTPLTDAPDLIIFSYALTMINPQWEELIRQAQADLRPGGYIAVTDFHQSQFPWFKTHMSGHHVRMDAHLLPVLQANFETVAERVRPAYLGVWEYFLFVGRK